jgi:hypothetical protein
MRMLLRVSIPVEAGNAAAKAGTLASTVEKILADLKPEAAYFFADDNGNRSGSIVFDMTDTSQIPEIAEPWFLAFNAKVSFPAGNESARSRQGRPSHWRGCKRIWSVADVVQRGSEPIATGSDPSFAAVCARIFVRERSVEAAAPWPNRYSKLVRSPQA